MNSTTKSYEGWNTESHLQEFDLWNVRSDSFFDFTYGCFAEQKFLNRAVQQCQKPDVLDVGCATGTTYRFLRNSNPKNAFEYRGVDLSQPAVNRAKALYPEARFEKKNHEKLHDYVGQRFDIVYSRDTVMHQTEPYKFLTELLDVAERFLVLRLRTRDQGETEFEIENSCQMHYDRHWMPYIVLNLGELTEKLNQYPRVKRVTINRSHQVLGGQNFRFLPKDLFYRSAGGAETALLIELDPNNSEGDIDIIYDEFLEGTAYLREHRYKNYAYTIVNKISRKFRFR